MSRILGKLSIPFTLFFAAFLLLIASLQLGRSAPRAEPRNEPAASSAGPSDDEPPSNEIPDFQQLD